jgi:hypothetical protein
MSNYRKKITSKDERPSYIDADGKVDLNKLFTFQPKQLELHRDVLLNGYVYRTLVAPQCLSVGGMRSGKTTGALMFGVNNFCLAFSHCDILVLRRTFKELENGAIADFKTFVPQELYDYDQTKHIATFKHNGSRVVFGHCSDLKERSIRQYLGQAYPFILVDECAQFSPDAWLLLSARNAVNASCEPDVHGNLPTPCMWGLTNPMGIWWDFYHTLWVLGEPWDKSETARKDLNGNWWEMDAGEPVCVRNTADYAYNTSTVFDNPEFIKRNPGYVAQMQAKPKAIRNKWLYGLMEKSEGQYFDCFTEEFHVVDIREDPEIIVWQEWQPVWAGQDWGMSHANATYLFTKALVKSPLTGEYSLKTVCFQEIFVTGGKTYKELASLIAVKAKLPTGKPCKVSAIYFSHEKFNRVMDAHSPADEYSKELRSYGLPAVTRATKDRIGSASFLYNELKNGRLVILDYCKEIITAIPRLQRDPNNLDDVLKINAKSDDAYDGFRLGLYGQLAGKSRPEADRVAEHAKHLDPIARHFYLQRKQNELAARKSTFVEKKSDVRLSLMQQ